MIIHWERERERERERQREICVKPVCLSGTIRFYYTAALHAWATDALGCVDWFTAHRRPHSCWLLKSVWVNCSPSSKRRGLSCAERPMSSSGRRAPLPWQTAPSLSVSLHPSLCLSRSSIALSLSPSVVATERGSGMCVGGSPNLHVCQEECTADRRPNTAMFRSVPQSRC